MPVNIGSLQFDATINLDGVAKETAKQLGDQIAEGVEEGLKQAEKLNKELESTVSVYKQIHDAGMAAGGNIENQFLAEAEAAEKLGVKLDASKQALLDYFAVQASFAAEGKQPAVNQRAPDPIRPDNAPPPMQSILGSDFERILAEAEAGMEDLDKSTQKYYQHLAQTEQRLSEVKAAQKELNIVNAAGKIPVDQYTKAYAALAAQEEMLLSTIDLLNQSQKSREEEMGVENGTIAHKQQLLTELKRQWEEVATAEFKSSEEGKVMLKSIADLKSEIDQLDPDNLTQAAEKAAVGTARLQELRNQMISMKPGDEGYDKLINEANVLANRIQNVNKELKLLGSNNSGLDATMIAVRGVIGGFTALQGVIGLTSGESKELQKTLLVVTSAMSVLQGVSEFSNALAKEGQLNQYLLSLFMKNTAAAAAVQTVATTELAAAQEVQSGAAAVNIAAAEGTAIAATDVAVAEEAQAVATIQAAGALEVLTTAMLANPATVLLVALTAIVGAMYAFVSSAETAEEKQIKVNDAISQSNELLERLAELYNEAYKQGTKNAEHAIALAQAQGKSEMDIFELRKKALDAKRLENIAMLSTKGYNLDVNNEVEKGLGLLKAELEMRTLEAEAIVNLQMLGQELTDNEKERLDLLKSQIKFLDTRYQSIKTASDNLKEVNAQQIQLAAEKNKKIADDALKSDADSAEARHILARKNTKAELDAAIDAINKKKAVELNDPNLTPGGKSLINANADKAIIDAKRQYAILQLNNDKSLLQEQLNMAEKGSAAELDIKKNLINKEAEIEQKAEGITAERQREIRSNARKANEDLDRAFRIKQLNDQKSDLKAQLDAAKEGSARELQIKQDIINKQLEIDLAAEGVSIARKKELEADAQKAISELVRKFAQDNTEAAINIRISSIQNELAQVEKGSKKELQLKKDLIDEKSALEAASAARTVKNEELLAAKLKEISSKANVDKRKEDNDFADKKYQQILKRIDADTNRNKLPFDKILNDPNSTSFEKFEANVSTLQEMIVALTTKQREALKVIASGKGDVIKAQEDYDLFRTAIHKLNDELDNLKSKRLSEFFKGIAVDINKVSGAFRNLSNALQDANPGLSATLETMADLGNVAGDLANSAASFATGDFISGGVAAVSAISGIFSIASKARESERKAMEQMRTFQLQILAGEVETNILYRERLRIQAQINKTKMEGLKAEADELRKQRQDSLTEYSKIFQKLQSESFISGQHTEKYGGFLGIGQKTRVVDDLASLAGKSFADLEKLFNSGQLTDRAKELFQQLQKLKQEGADIDQQLLDIQKQAAELYTGTTSDSILDGIIEGFKNGLRSASDFADNFEDLMRQAVINSLKYKTLEKPLQEFYEQFAKLTQSGDVLSASEIEQLRKIYNDIIGKASAQFANLQNITGLSLSGAGGDGNSLKGAIKGITEQQASLLAGQFGAQRLTLLDILNVNTQMLNSINMIVNNTAYLVQSHSILRDFQINGIKIK